jgi:NADPH-dependent glutamate synthase beta subunit-like oxidoreductase
MPKVKVPNATIEDVLCTDGKIYLPPCQVRCPLDEDVQRNHAMIAHFPKKKKDAEKLMMDIGHDLFDQNPLFPIICGNICGLCEEECNYKDETGAIRRRKVIWPVGKLYLEYLKTAKKFPAPKKDKVAVIGSGPAGIMCAFELSKKGYAVTIFERKNELGGALRYIPKYRLPTKTLDSLIDNVLRIANVKVKKRVNIGSDGITFDDLQKGGYKAIFMATGTPNPRILSIESETPEFKEIIERLVKGDESHGVKFGLSLLYDVDRGDIPLDHYKGKKVIVIGGGNVAFDVARTARRLGGKVTVMCLECEDKNVTDGIPADVEEIEGAEEEGIEIIYSRGVDGIVTKNGKFKKIKTLRCECVFQPDGAFNPEFDHGDVKYIKGDVLLVTIGQAPERAIYENEGLLNKKGRIEIDPITLMSTKKKGIFVGGDVNRVGFASEAMRDGKIAAESIDLYIQKKDMKKGRDPVEYESAEIPKRALFKSQPEVEWTSVNERMNFEPFEKDYSWDEVLEEALRCLYCGPCKSCKGCVELKFIDEIPDIVVDEELCSGCAVCVSLCPYDALELKPYKDRKVLEIDVNKCKRCGSCVTACPSNAITIIDKLHDELNKNGLKPIPVVVKSK